MKQKSVLKRVTSIAMIIVMIVTLMPNNLRKVKAETATDPVRRVDDVVELVDGVDRVPMKLYANGMYEAKVNAASGSAIQVEVNGNTVKTSTWESNGKDVYVRYDSKTKEVKNSVANSTSFKTAATWVGALDTIEGAGLSKWKPSDTKADLEYIGGGIYQKQFNFTQLTNALELKDGGYKVAYNNDWNNGEVGDDQKVKLTIPAGVSNITVYADSISGYITDSVNTPSIAKSISLIGTVRCNDSTNWTPSVTGWEFTNINGEYGVYNQVLPAGNYEYKIVYNHADWASWGNRSIELSKETNVVYVYDYATDSVYDSVNNYNKVAKTLGFPIEGETEIVPDEFVAQPGGDNVWRITGDVPEFDSWNQAGANGIMSHLVGGYYAKSVVLQKGTYNFKFTKNGSWNDAIGNVTNGDNIKLVLDKETKVNFYLNEDLEGYNRVRINLDSLESQGIKQYVPKRSEETWPRLVGTIQTEIGDKSDWSPADATNMLVDYYFDDTEYRIQRTLSPKQYSVKVVYGNSWDAVDYGDGSSDHKVNVLDRADVTFTTKVPSIFEDGKGTITDNYKPQNSAYDGKISTDDLYFDSQSTTYKNPFGAIPMESQDVTFRFAAKAGDAQYVKLELTDKNDIAKSFNMAIATTLEDKDYWEVTVPAKEFDSIGVWTYKFIVIDSSVKVEYGDDGISGGTGAFAEEGQTGYNLTVYEKDYKTPDWMKNAVVYQIFPDRFYDGDHTNNQAKLVDGSRGSSVQLFDGSANSAGNWSDLPENPRQSEEANKPYYPNATTDGVWSNEFYGGDISGIKQKLSYLQNLGVTAIYLNPVSWAASNHKYDATDYKHLDPMFGEPVYNVKGDPTSGLNYEETKKASDKVYEAFADACNDLGIYLIADGVFNHVGDDSIYFDRYEKYPEIGAYEYWSRVWDLVSEKKISQSEAEKEVKNYYKSQINPSTNQNYTDDDFAYTTWFEVGPDKVYDEDTKSMRYKYECWWGYSSLPCVKAVKADETNLTNNENATIAGAHEYNNVDYRNEVIGYDLTDKSADVVSKAMQQANSQRWLWMGASGWRLDVAPDVSDETWQQFRKAVKSAAGQTDVNGNTIPDPIILGEEWGVATDYLLGDMFDSVMNYQFRAALQNFIINGADAATLHSQLETIRENYPKEAWYAMLNLVDSHDTVRNITKIDNPTWEEENTKNAPEASERAIKLQALTAIFQLSYPGAPTIYYGDEVGVTGTKDPDSRRTFPWERIDSTNNTIASSYADKYGDLYDSYVKAASVRNENKDIFATGDIQVAYAEGSVIAYARKSASKGGLSVINTSEKPVTFEANVEDFLPEGLTLKDQLGSGIQATVTDGKMSITVPAYSGLMMVSTQSFTELPVEPANVNAVSTNGATSKVTVTWDAVDGADSYKVYRSYLDGTEKTLLSTVSSSVTSYEDSNVVNGTRYYYYIKTVKSGRLSNYSKYATALPSYVIESMTNTATVADVTLGVGNKTEDIKVTVKIPGLTDNETYAGKDVPGLSIMLNYYLEGNDLDEESVKLRYNSDVLESEKVVGKVYTASFEPTQVGTYKYYAKATVNNGYSYSKSDVGSMIAKASAETAKPEAPVLENSISESNRVTLAWTCDSSKASGYDIFRGEYIVDQAGKRVLSKYTKIATVSADIKEYVDFAVNNDTTYQYYVEAFNQYYNRNASKTMEVTPKLVMVDVTMRLTIPSKVYTSATDSIYIASDANGWTANGWELKKPSGATDGNIVEYTFKMMAGKKIQYKYTRGTWATEALTSNKEFDNTSPGNYGYSSMDTNISLTIKNEGGNKMLVKDYVLRWVDMPLMVTVPRISYGDEDIAYSTSDSTFNLQASVPIGGIFTINGEDINSIQAGALDQYGNVRLDNIPLKVGVNQFVLHIEPTAETKAKSWLTDTGRIESQMSATKTITITRTGSDPVKPSDPSSSSSSNNNTVDSKEPKLDGGVSGWKAIEDKISDIVKKLESSTDNVQQVKIVMNGTTKVPVELFTLIVNKPVEVILDFGEYTWSINGSSIDQKELQALLQTQKDIDFSIEIVKDQAVIKEQDQILSNTLAKNKDTRDITKLMYIELMHNGKFPFIAKLTIGVDKKYIGKSVFLSYCNEINKTVEPQCYNRVTDQAKATFTFDHASKYVITLENPVLPTLLKTKTLYTGKSYKLSAQVKNALMGDAATYYSSKKSVVSVDKKGVLTAKKAGKAIITTRYVQNGKVYVFKTTITVKKPYIKLTATRKSLKVKDTFTFKAKSYGTTDKLVWSVSDKTVASIDKNTGKLIAKKAGKVTVTVKSGRVTNKITIVIK